MGKPHTHVPTRVSRGGALCEGRQRHRREEWVLPISDAQVSVIADGQQSDCGCEDVPSAESSCPFPSSFASESGLPALPFLFKGWILSASLSCGVTWLGAAYSGKVEVTQAFHTASPTTSVGVMSPEHSRSRAEAEP